MQMSIAKYANVQEIFDRLIAQYGISNKYKGLSDWLGVPYQTLMAWKKRNSIGDYSYFMDKGISKAWLQNMQGPIQQHLASRGLSERTCDGHPGYSLDAAKSGLSPVISDNSISESLKSTVPLREDQQTILSIWEQLSCEQKGSLIIFLRTIMADTRDD